MRLVFARTRENPVAARAIVAQGCARHQLVSVGHPTFEAALELLREVHRIFIALGTARRARGERLLVGLLQVLNRMAGARIDRRIEQHQRVESATILERMHRSRDARQRMKQSGGGLRAQLAINSVPDHVHIVDEILPRVPFRAVQRVVAVIAEVEDDNLVARAQRSPEWKVAVDGEAVAVTEHEARRAGNTVLANVDRRAIVHLHVEGVMRPRHMMKRVMLAGLVHFLNCSQHPYRIDIDRKKYVVAIGRRPDLGAHRGDGGSHRFQFARF